MASEVIKLNLIPKGEMPVFHASQFDTGRLITCELYRGEDAYSVPEGYTVELHCRKVDNNIVTMASTLINDNVVTFTSTEQLTACNGKNLCEVAILDDGYRIGTLNFILEVEVDPLKGGINSTSEIHNLETQVEEITTEVIGEDYYDKSEVDDLLALKANAADVYTKSQTDTLLSAKANSSDVYTKGQVDTALSVKADTTYVDAEVDDLEAAIDTKADASTTTAALATKADKSDTYTKEQVDALIDSIFPTLTASGTMVTFKTALTKPLVSVTATAGATAVTRCGVNLFDGAWFVDGAWNNSTNLIKVFEGVSYYANTPNIPNNEGLFAYFYDNNKQRIDNTKHLLGRNAVFTIPSGVAYIQLILWSAFDYTDLSINYPATDTTYHPYTGNTVPVADATTLVTEAGINNVFADSGNVTVQYKYMSI